MSQWSAAFMPLQRSASDEALFNLKHVTLRALKRHKCRARALERERAQEGGSPSVAELPASNGK